MENLIKANRTILWNKKSNAVFVATKATEQTQCKGENREHIVPIGCELTIPITDNEVLLLELYDEIKHGDDEHQKWLYDKIKSFIDRKCF